MLTGLSGKAAIHLVVGVEIPTRRWCSTQWGLSYFSLVSPKIFCTITVLLFIPSLPDIQDLSLWTLKVGCYFCYMSPSPHTFNLGTACYSSLWCLDIQGLAGLFAWMSRQGFCYLSTLWFKPSQTLLASSNPSAFPLQAHFMSSPNISLHTSESKLCELPLYFHTLSDLRPPVASQAQTSPLRGGGFKSLDSMVAHPGQLCACCSTRWPCSAFLSIPLQWFYSQLPGSWTLYTVVWRDLRFKRHRYLGSSCLYAQVLSHGMW